MRETVVVLCVLREEEVEVEKQRRERESGLGGHDRVGEIKGVRRIYQNAPPFYLSFIFVPGYLGIGTASLVRTPNSNPSNVDNLIAFRKRLNKSNND